MYDLRPFINDVENVVKSHNLGEPGKYAQFITQNEKGTRNLGLAPYGSANAINILYTINRTPTDLSERAAFIKVLQDFQNKENGFFENPGNFPSHTTAFLCGALNLLDAKPLYAAEGFKDCLTKEGIFAFMDKIDWAKEPWLGAHLGAGIYGSVLLSGLGGDEFDDNYFEWLDANADPVTGLWKKDALSGAPAFHYIASTFHYVFNYEYARRALPYPKELLDTCIKAYRNGVCMDFSKEIGWPDIDFTYVLARVQRRAGTRFEETQTILKEIADGLITQLLKLDVATNDRLNDLNTLFAIVCALAVLQDALPGYIRTSKPLQLVLDKRPFL
ncbi:MAG: hypothetical protein IJW18_06855 [Lachnospiraceae bacterium]|nr:hypothetical protein [Lachnospiraceae bacterium]